MSVLIELFQIGQYWTDSLFARTFFGLFLDLVGEAEAGFLTGDFSLAFADAIVFWTATLSVKRLSGSLRSSFSSSTGVYWSMNSSMDR